MMRIRQMRDMRVMTASISQDHADVKFAIARSASATLTGNLSFRHKSHLPNRFTAFRTFYSRAARCAISLSVRRPVDIRRSRRLRRTRSTAAGRARRIPSSSRPMTATASRTASARAANAAAWSPTPGARRTAMARRSLSGARTTSRARSASPRRRARQRRAIRRHLRRLVAARVQRTKSAHFAGSPPAAPQGSIGTVEVEFFGEPSISLSV